MQRHPKTFSTVSRWLFAFFFSLAYCVPVAANQSLSYVRWSPDGEKLTFFANWDGDYEIYIINVDGSELKQLTTNDHYDLYPSFSNDGKTIFFSSAVDGQISLYSINVAGGEPQRLLPKKNKSTALQPVQVADGRIAFQSRSPESRADIDIHLFNMETGEIDVLIDSPHNDVDLAWSAGKERILFASDRTGKYEIYFANLDGGDAQRLTWYPEDRDRTGSRMPSFSADGRHFVYWGDEGGKFKHDHHGHYRDLETGQDQVLPKWRLVFGYPMISPDGNHIAYASTSAEDMATGTNWGVYIMNIDTHVEDRVWPDPKQVWPPWYRNSRNDKAAAA